MMDLAGCIPLTMESRMPILVFNLNNSGQYAFERCLTTCRWGRWWAGTTEARKAKLRTARGN